MINLRYHIVSITAVFLALGIGLTLGSTFLDRVTVDNLKHQLDTVQRRVDATETQNGALRSDVDALTSRDDALSDELPERLLSGRLDAVSVLVVATRGTDEDLVRATVRTLSGAGARVAGTWWLTDRWLLDGGDEADRLASILELTTRDPDRLRRIAAIRLAELMNGASLVPPSATDPAAPPAPTPEDAEPALVASLVDAGFLDYEPVSGTSEARVLLPGSAARYVVVGGALPEAGPQLIASALLAELVAAGPAPVVAAQGDVDLRDEKGPAPRDARHTTFVGPLRGEEQTKSRLSTIDDLDSAAGMAALVLAVEDLGAGRVGHYGSTGSAARLLPSEPGG